MAGSSDVFLSYSKSDSAKAKNLAAALQREGLSVWWDHKISPGKNWPDALQDSINNSRCVVVLWSSTSIKSKWVKKEARFGDKLDRLVPAIIEAVELPFEFEHVQAADLTDWEGTKTDGFADLVAELHSRVQTVAIPTKGKDPKKPVPSSEKAALIREAEADVRVTSMPPAQTPPAPKGWTPIGQTGLPRVPAYWAPPTPNDWAPVRVGSKQAPRFWASSKGTLLIYLAGIAAIWGIGIPGGYLVAPIASYLHLPALSSTFFSWTQRMPSLPTLIGLAAEAAIVVATWVFADDEVPVGAMEYMMVTAKAVGFALISAVFIAVAFRSPTQAWLRIFPLIAVSTAALTASAYATIDELL